MINLLPPKRLLNIRIARTNTVLKRYIILVVLGVAILGGAVAASYYFLNSQQVNIKQTLVEQQKAQQLEPIQKQAEELSVTVNTIAALLTRNIKFSDMLTTIGGLMPNGAVLTGLQFSIEDLDAPLVISAKVENEELAAVLRNNLAGSDLFKGADIESIRIIEESKTPANTNTSEDGTATPVPPQPVSKYKYVTVINAYFKDLKGKP